MGKKSLAPVRVLSDYDRSALISKTANQGEVVYLSLVVARLQVQQDIDAAA
jgi:hypothetical protein